VVPSAWCGAFRDKMAYLVMGKLFISLWLGCRYQSAEDISLQLIAMADQIRNMITMLNAARAQQAGMSAAWEGTSAEPV